MNLQVLRQVKAILSSFTIPARLERLKAALISPTVNSL